jgi:hypothetical protein
MGSVILIGVIADQQFDAFRKRRAAAGLVDALEVPGIGPSAPAGAEDTAARNG